MSPSEFYFPPETRRVGIIAGWGRYPVLLAEAIKRNGREVVCLGVRDHADPILQEICDDFAWGGLGKFGWATRYFRRRGVEFATMAGKIHKIRLFDPGFLWKQAPDLYTVRFFADHFLRRRRDCKKRGQSAACGCCRFSFHAFLLWCTVSCLARQTPNR